MTRNRAYQMWLERVMAGREGPALKEGSVVSLPPPVPGSPIQFAETSRKWYRAEVGKRGGDYIFHFFPPKNPPKQKYPMNFEDAMGDAFLEVFKIPERVMASYVPELESWAVRAVGFAANPLGDELVEKLFDTLDRILG